MYRVRSCTATALLPWAPGTIWLACLLAAAPAYGQEMWRLVPEARVIADAHRDYVLDQGRQIAVGRDGEVYTAERYEVLVFDRDGQPLRRIGRRGAGPGEFEQVRSIGVRGDTLWVMDQLQARISYFGADGRLLSTFRLPPAMDARSARPIRSVSVLADGSVLGLPDLPAYEPGGPLLQPLPLLVYRPNGTLDTLAVMKGMPNLIRFTTPAGSQSAVLRSPRNNDRWAAAPDGSFIVVVSAVEVNGRIGAYTVEAIRPSGQRIFRRRFEHAPVPVAAEEQDRTLAGFANDLVSRGVPSRAAALRQARELLPLPQHRLAVGHVFIDADHRIWLSRWDLVDRLLVLDGATGAEVAHALLPEDELPRSGADAARGGTAWMMKRDMYGVLQLVRYRIRTGAGP
jgi:hypothetical protein